MIAFLALFAVAVIVCDVVQRRRTLPASSIVARGFVVVALVASAAMASPGGLVLQKLVGRAALPPGLVWLAAIVFSAWQIARRDRRRTAQGIAAIVVVTVLGNEPLGAWLMQRLEAPFQQDPFAEAPFDAVVVLGGGASSAPHEHYELSPSGDRLLLGARLWHAKQTPLLVATGTKIEGFQMQFDNLHATRTIWRELGVVDSAVVIVDDTRTTAEEAAAVARLVRERRWTRVGLVTSAWHMRRALRLMARQDLGDAVVVPLAADHRGTPTWEGLYSLVPVGQGAWLQQKALWELLGAAVGR